MRLTPFYSFLLPGGFRGIFLVGHRVQPRDAAASHVVLRATLIRRRSMPVRHTRRTPDHFAGVQFNDWAALFLSEGHTLFNQNQLTLFMNMPFRPRARVEMDI